MVGFAFSGYHAWWDLLARGTVGEATVVQGEATSIEIEGGKARHNRTETHHGFPRHILNAQHTHTLRAF